MDIAIAGVPFDQGSYGGTGQRFGPDQARAFSHTVQQVHALFSRIVAAGAVPMGIGGDHTTTLLIMRGMARAGVMDPSA
ncbi:arginase family protein [Mesorhizobium sp. M0244]|uniref:arginase family protein n=1 Tax=Mesorhizobium sp. M0244 TaxID=2956926 RepID=UPI003336DC26